MASFTPFEDSAGSPAVRGFLHTPDNPSGDALVLTHGAGSNATAPLLAALAEELAGAGIAVLRCDLPFRQARPHGSPFPAAAAQDRAGLARAVEVMRQRFSGKIFLGGQSYGGRQATMLAAEQPELAAGLLLLSYPLHAPRRGSELRTGHFPQLTTRSLFVHGTRDPFGSIEEMRGALQLIPGAHELVVVEGAGHDLRTKSSTAHAIKAAVEAFQSSLRA